jgi:hypothetical protein
LRPEEEKPKPPPKQEPVEQVAQQPTEEKVNETETQPAKKVKINRGDPEFPYYPDVRRIAAAECAVVENGGIVSSSFA